MKTQAEKYAFAMNVSELEKDEFVIAPGHVLRRATQNEIETIRRIMKQITVGPAPSVPATQMHWEHEPPASGSGPYKPLPPDKLRYFVMTFQGSYPQIQEFQQAADISIRELELNLWIMDGDKEWRCQAPVRLFHLLHPSPFGRLCKPFSISDAAELSSIYFRLKVHNGRLFDIERTVSEIAQLKEIDQGSHLVVLGYFAMLEAMLTHLPKPSDPYDSITRQIKNKLALLDNRWSPRIDYSPFGGTKPEKVWEKMYSYRSAIAHGTKPDFGSDLRVLRGPDVVFSLVKETVKSIARFALLDPQLLQDLKNC